MSRSFRAIEWLSSNPLGAGMVVAATFAIGVAGGVYIGTTPTTTDDDRRAIHAQSHDEWERSQADSLGVVIPSGHRSLDDAVREDLGMSGQAEWEDYGRRVRAEIGGVLVAGAAPDDITVSADGVVSAPGVTGDPVPGFGTTGAPTTGSGDRGFLSAPSPMWGCSVGLPVTVDSAATEPEQVWLTAAHCLVSHRFPFSMTPQWSNIFGGDPEVVTAGSAIATGGVRTDVDYAPDYGITRKSTIPQLDGPAHPEQQSFDGALPPVDGLKVCAATRHGWRCGTINDEPAPGVVGSTTYASGGDSGSIAGVGGAAVYVLAWSAGVTEDWGLAQGYSVVHILDHAAANGWTIDIGWRN